jgi:hypothetical protein
MSAVRPLRSLVNVRSLHGVRVLLVGRDTRYVRAIDFLLNTSGYETRRLVWTGSLPREATRFDADVVFVEAGRGFADAARQVAQVAGLTPEIGVVVAVEGELPAGSERLAFVEKWAKFDDLLACIERVWAELPARDAQRMLEPH